MQGLNKTTLIGRIATDLKVESRGEQALNVCDFLLAINDGENKATIVSCTALGNTANALVKYQQKGDLIAVEGKLQSYENSKSNYNLKVIVTRVIFLSQKYNKDQNFDSNENYDANYNHNFKKDNENDDFDWDTY